MLEHTVDCFDMVEFFVCREARRHWAIMADTAAAAAAVGSDEDEDDDDASQTHE